MLQPLVGGRRDGVGKDGDFSHLKNKHADDHFLFEL